MYRYINKRNGILNNAHADMINFSFGSNLSIKYFE